MYYYYYYYYYYTVVEGIMFLGCPVRSFVRSSVRPQCLMNCLKNFDLTDMGNSTFPTYDLVRCWRSTFSGQVIKVKVK